MRGATLLKLVPALTGLPGRDFPLHALTEMKQRVLIVGACCTM